MKKRMLNMNHNKKIRFIIKYIMIFEKYKNKEEEIIMRTLLNTKVVGNIEVSHIVTTAFIMFCGYLMLGDNGALSGAMKAWYLRF